MRDARIFLSACLILFSPFLQRNSTLCSGPDENVYSDDDENVYSDDDENVYSDDDENVFGGFQLKCSAEL